MSLVANRPKWGTRYSWRRLFQLPLALAVLHGASISPAIAQLNITLDSTAAGTSFSPGVRGMALTDPIVNTPPYFVGLPKTLQVARGSSIRGLSPGIAAEIYDWRDRRAGEPRVPTLEFLRYARDYNAELVLNVNMRGLVEPNPDPQYNYRYYDTRVETLADLAADWVRYTNHIVPTYRQGDVISDPRDAAILNSLKWSSSAPGDSFDELLRPAESPTQKVTYWEIGNEPEVGVTAYGVSNSYTFRGNVGGFKDRYAAITAAMLAEDPTIKVGPTIINGSRDADYLNAILADESLQIDFVGYHPYERMGDLTAPADIQAHLTSIYNRQKSFVEGISFVFRRRRRDISEVELIASETNVSYWSYNDTPTEAMMAHALGSVETIFSHARLGIKASHYWIWPAHAWDGTEYPSYKAFAKLRDHMGDTLLSVHEQDNVRLYTTRDSMTGELAVWAINFDSENDASLDLELAGIGQVENATWMTLGSLTGKTTYFSANLASDMPGGPTYNVDWTSIDMSHADFANLALTLPAATISLLVVNATPIPEPLSFHLVLSLGALCLASRGRVKSS